MRNFGNARAVAGHVKKTGGGGGAVVGCQTRPCPAPWHLPGRTPTNLNRTAPRRAPPMSDPDRSQVHRQQQRPAAGRGRGLSDNPRQPCKRGRALH